MNAVRYEVTEQADEASCEAVRACLLEFDRLRNAPNFEARDRLENAVRPLHVFAFDAGSTTPVGGLLGDTMMSWLKVRYLAVREAFRGRGIGRELLVAAEREGAARGCKYAYLDTMSYQAGPFYERLGYTLCGRLVDWDSHGHDQLFYTKRIGCKLTPP